MKSLHWHRWFGLALTAPLLIWIVTGAVFLARPGYEAAYSDLAVKSYPLSERSGPTPRADWHEVRRLRTVLGPHLLVRTDDGWRQRDPESFSARERPTEREVRALISDAIGGHERYGRIEAVSGDRIDTSTGVRIELDWPTLSLDQRGRDTRWISWSYDVHSVEWTGIAALDKLLGALVLLLLATSSGIGVWLALRPSR